MDIKKFEDISSTEDEPKNYMFFNNLNTIKDQIDSMLESNEEQIDALLEEHNWILDSISSAQNDIEGVFNFLNQHVSSLSYSHED